MSDLSLNTIAKIEEEVRRYGEKWYAHLTELNVIKYDLSAKGQVDFDYLSSKLDELIDAAKDGHRSYLLAKARMIKSIEK